MNTNSDRMKYLKVYAGYRAKRWDDNGEHRESLCLGDETKPKKTNKASRLN